MSLAGFGAPGSVKPGEEARMLGSYAERQPLGQLPDRSAPRPPTWAQA